jgi:hypothetical protein
MLIAIGWADVFAMSITKPESLPDMIGLLEFMTAWLLGLYTLVRIRWL